MGTWHCRGLGVQAVHPAGAGEIGGVGAEDKNSQEQHAEGNPGLVKVLCLGQEIDLGLEEAALVLDLETRRYNYGISCILGLSHPLNRKKLIIQKPVGTRPTNNR